MRNPASQDNSPTVSFNTLNSMEDLLSRKIKLSKDDPNWSRIEYLVSFLRFNLQLTLLFTAISRS